MSIQVFISYSSTDRLKVRSLSNYLERELIVWWDQDLISGQKFASELFVKINKATIVLVAHSENSIKSDWVMRETKEALAQNKIVIPILLDSTPLPPHLEQYDGIDLRGWNDSSFHPQIAQLIRDIKLHIAVRERPFSPNLSHAPAMSSPPKEETGGCFAAAVGIGMLLFAAISILKEFSQPRKQERITPQASTLITSILQFTSEGKPPCEAAAATERRHSLFPSFQKKPSELTTTLLAADFDKSASQSKLFIQKLYDAGCMTPDWTLSQEQAQTQQTYPSFLFDLPTQVDWADAVRNALAARAHDTAFDLLEAAAKNDPRAKGLLGVFHALQIVPRSQPDIAFRLISEAANAGDVLSRANLGLLQLTGYGTFLDPVAGEKNLKEALAKGVQASEVLWLVKQGGRLFQLSTFAETIKTLELAANEGRSAAKALLGVFNAMGLGHPPCAPSCEVRAMELALELSRKGESKLAEIVAMSLRDFHPLPDSLRDFLYRGRTAGAQAYNHKQKADQAKSTSQGTSEGRRQGPKVGK